MNIKVNQILKTISKITKPPGRFDIIEDSNFSYSNDREFIRLVAKKNNWSIH